MFKKILLGLLFTVLPISVFSAQITVPSAPTSGYFLVSTTTGNYVASSTPSFLNGFYFSNATGTRATTTNFFSTTASTTNLFGSLINGFGLTTCNSASNALTWASGVFGCNTISGGGGTGGGTWATTTSSVTGEFVNYSLNTTDIVAIGNSATTSAVFWFDPNTTFAKFGGNLLVTGSTTLQRFTATFATTTQATSTNIFSTNLFSTTFNNSGLGTLGNLLVTGSSTLQNFTGVNATTTNATSTTFAVTGLTANQLVASNGTGGLVSTSTIGNNQLQNSSIVVTTASPLGGAGTIPLGGTLALTCTGCTTNGVTSVTGTWPITSSGGATPNITWSGLASSSNLTTSNLFYSTGANTFGQVATTSLGVSTGILFSGTIGAQVGGSGGSFTVDQSFSPTWTGAHIFNNITRSTTTQATSTNFFSVVGSHGSLAVGKTSTTTIGTDGALTVTGSTTLQNFTFVNATGTQATTSSFAITGVAAGCSGSNALNTTSNGSVICGAVSGSGGSPFPFTPDTNYGALTVSTGTPVWFKAGLQASSTSYFANLFAVNATTTNATTTTLNVSGTATSTFAGGINITSGCFAILSTCLTSSGFGNPFFVSTTSVGNMATDTLSSIPFGAHFAVDLYIASTTAADPFVALCFNTDQNGCGAGTLSLGQLYGYSTVVEGTSAGVVSGVPTIRINDSSATSQAVKVYIHLDIFNGTSTPKFGTYTYSMATSSTYYYSAHGGFTWASTTAAINSISMAAVNLGNPGTSYYIGAGSSMTAFALDDITNGASSGSGGNSKWATSSNLVITPNGGGGILVNASSTIGNGTSAGGLTINGTATTTNLITLASTTLQNFTFVNATGTSATTTNFSTTNASTTNLTVSSAGGTAGCATFSATGFISNTGTACGSGSGSGNSKWATTSSVSFPNAISPNGGNNTLVGIGTSTPNFQLTIASSTAPQINLMDALGNNGTAFRNIGGLTYVATTSPTTNATSSANLVSWDINGNVTFPRKLTTPGVVVTNTGTLSSQVIQQGVSSAAAPAFTSSNGSSNAGVFFDNATDVGLSAKGVEGLRVSNPGLVGVGTTTPQWKLQVASSTGPQIALTDGISNNHWTMRNAGGNFYMATASPSTYATSSTADFSITGTNASAHLGPESCGTGGVTAPNLLGLEVCGSDNSTGGGVQVIVSNTSSGANAWTGLEAINNLGDLTLTHYSGLFMNSSNYTDTSFGTAIAVKNLAYLQSTDGALDIISSTSTEALNPAGINFLTGGTATANQRMRIDINGNVGVGTSTPFALLSIGAPAQTAPLFTIGSTTSNGGPGTVMSVSYQNYSSLSAGGSTTPDAIYTLNATTTSTAGGFANVFNVASTTAAKTSTASLFRVTPAGAIYAPLTTTSGSSQTGYWCYDGQGQMIRDTTVCLVSALKFKKDIHDLTAGLPEVMQMQPVTYYLKTPFGKEDSGQQIGFVADWAERILPQLVTHDSDGAVHGFSYEQYTAVLTKAIQDQQHEIENLKLGVMTVTRSAEENWQDALIGLLILYVIYNEYSKRKKI